MKYWLMTYFLIFGYCLRSQVIPFGFLKGSIIKSGISTNGLIFNLDASDSSSYSGSGSIWKDVIGANHVQFYNSSSYTSSADPIFSSEGGGSLITTGIYGKSIRNSGIFGRAKRSFEAWVKFNSVSANAIISIGNTSACRKLFEMMAYQDQLIDNVWCISLTPSKIFRIGLGIWHHVVITYNANLDHFIYVNGDMIAVPVGYMQLSTPDTPIYIGTGETTTWGPFDGKIATLRIYDRVLSLKEVKANRDATKSRFGY
jgi:hypothetical protein